ncbi:MAG: AAA family ATPase, partial [Saprospiraceae bacterium]
MKINSLTLENFRLFRNLKIEFPDENLTVLIGENGSGKSAILDAIAIWLAQFIIHADQRNSTYVRKVEMTQNDINAEAEKGEIYVVLSSSELNNKVDEVNIKVSLDRDNHIEEGSVHIPGNIARWQLHTIFRNFHPIGIPVLAYYRVNRSSENDKSRFPVDTKSRDKRFIAYENALNKHVSSFGDFTAWFIDQENLENQKKVNLENLRFRLPTLETVRSAVQTLVAGFPHSGFGRIRVERDSSPHSSRFKAADKSAAFVAIEKQGNFIPLESLSSGEKSIILLVADIARRFCIANPDPDGDPLKGPGVVLIDEIELHLHPAWQRSILGSLQAIFPNLQFIVTTHS